MSLVEFYDKLENPFPFFNENNIDLLINLYSQSKSGELYDELVHVYNHQNQSTNQHDKDEYNALMFNHWKYIIKYYIPEESYVKLSKNYCSAEEAKRFRNFVINLPDVNSKSEIDSLFSKNEEMNKLLYEVGLYRGIKKGWHHVIVSDIYSGVNNFNTNEVEHRLYFNVDPQAIYKFITALYEKYNDHKLPFYYKYDLNCSRDDNVVIYSSTKDLNENLEIINEIKMENPELMDKFNTPPLLTGKVDGWFGYGAEPKRLPEKSSFNKKRSQIITDAINKSVKEWILNNQDEEIFVRNHRYTIIDLYSKFMAKYFNRKDKYDMFYFKNKIISGNMNFSEGMDIFESNGLSFTQEKITKYFARNINLLDPNFKKEVIKNIKVFCEEAQIDFEKGIGNIDTRELLYNEDIKFNKANTESINEGYNRHF